MSKRKTIISEMPSPIYVKKLKTQRRSLGLLQFQTRTDRNFTKWESMTENLIISCFEEESNQHTQFSDLVHKLYSDG